MVAPEALTVRGAVPGAASEKYVPTYPFSLSVQSPEPLPLDR